MSTTQQTPARLYGGWRKSKTMGIGLLNTGQTVIVVVAILLPIFIVNAAGMTTLVVTVPVALVVIALACWQRHGMPLLDLAVGRVRWQWAHWRGETSYRGLYLPHPRVLDLPGVLAPTKLLRVEDTGSGGGRAGLIWNQATGQFAATLLLSPNGTLLSARGQAESQVSSWADTLARLADEDAVDAATVTMQITPASGAALADHARERMASGAPALAKATLRELVDATPRASATMAAWFTLVMNPAKAAEKPSTPAEAAAEALRCLDGVDLGGAGADVLRRATDTDLIRIVRGAFRPHELDAPAAEIAELTWDEAGPVAADDWQTRYDHDGYSSVTWVLREAPRKAVPYSVLLPLLAPGRFSRRITIGYRVLPTEEAAAVVQREVNASDARQEYRTQTRRSTTRRERADAEAADRTAHQEAHGAGLVQWTIHVTTTARPEDLEAAKREVEQIAKKSGGLRFRFAYHSQAAAFAAGLPVGVHPLAA
ncbi:SCO6880 family protein [Streptomyces sp. NRRL WC-3742]|uniref:SCO6880 family protein n=1 Tax=Streptomyces sp. NRRL WC-3742 TaxID=1463934 RepID=UPI000690A190|nr:SCO6880 family protein [Streptomyces sp. NRRL WC-3742]